MDILYYTFNLVKTVIFSNLLKLNSINSNKFEIYTHTHTYIYSYIVTYNKYR